MCGMMCCALHLLKLDDIKKEVLITSMELGLLKHDDEKTAMHDPIQKASLKLRQFAFLMKTLFMNHSGFMLMSVLHST